MYKAKIFWSMGLGLEVASVSASNYARLKEEVKSIVNLNGTHTKFIDYDTIIKVSKIVYYYPSGKTYTEVIA